MAPWSPPFFRIYSPTPNPKSSSLNVLDAEGAYIKHFVPELKDMPAKFIYAPWTAPGPVQQKAKCIIGTDYPQPIVDHKTTSKANLDNFKKALHANRSAAKGAGKGGGKGGGKTAGKGPNKSKAQEMATKPVVKKQKTDPKQPKITDHIS